MLDAARRSPGYSLTMPLKVDVLPLLDDLEPLARSVGVVNTVVPAGGGRLVGANTDLPLHTGGARGARRARLLAGRRARWLPPRPYSRSIKRVSAPAVGTRPDPRRLCGPPNGVRLG